MPDDFCVSESLVPETMVPVVVGVDDVADHFPEPALGDFPSCFGSLRRGPGINYDEGLASVHDRQHVVPGSTCRTRTRSPSGVSWMGKGSEATETCMQSQRIRKHFICVSQGFGAGGVG